MPDHPGSAVATVDPRGQIRSTLPFTALETISQQPNHVFWPDDIGYADASLRGVIGHRQVTDAYLAALAEHHGAVVATLIAASRCSTPTRRY